MRFEALPSPGVISGSHKLRAEVCKAISFCEVSKAFNPHKTPVQATTLLAFFEAAADAVRGLIVVEPGTETESTPGGNTRSRRTTKEST